MKVMKRKKVEVESMVDQNVWNISDLTDQERLALGMGSTIIFPRPLRSSCAYLCDKLFSLLCFAGSIATTEDIQDVSEAMNGCGRSSSRCCAAFAISGCTLLISYQY
jgi:hypothetical protein